MHRFFLPPQSFDGPTVTVTDSNVLHQMRAVLRMQAGTTITCLDGSGMEYVVRIDGIKKERMTGTVLEERRNAVEPVPRISLFQALPKQLEKFEWVLQKGTEIGISLFHPLVTARTERHTVSEGKWIRLQRILTEAAEQSGRGIVPTLSPPVSFSDALSHLSGPALLAHTASSVFLSTLLPITASSLSLFIGPEGGLTDDEIALAQRNGVTVFGLGPRILRTETAPLAIAATIIYSR